MKLLILEDCPLIGQQLAQLAHDCGHDVGAITRDAGEALRLADATRPDILIADVDLGGGGDGIAAAILIREATNVRALFVTACNDVETRNRAQGAWPLGFVTKPFACETVATALAGASSVLHCNFARRYLLEAISRPGGM